MLIPATLAKHTIESLYAAHGPERTWVYWLLLLGTSGALTSSTLIMVDVSVQAPGIVRPVTERAELKSATSGRIARVLVHDNDQVKAEQPLLVLDSRDLDERIARNQALQAEHSSSISDLLRLTSETGRDRAKAAIDFHIPALRQELIQHCSRIDSYQLAETKARSELARYITLTKKGITTQQELDNARYEVERLQAESRLLVEQDISRWLAKLQEERNTLTGLISDQQRLNDESKHYIICAPVAGVLLGFSGLSPEVFVTAGQSLGMVSPSDTLLVEAYVSPRNIGLVLVGQTARLQIDAYPYTQWGTLDGIVETIGDDLMSGYTSATTNLAPTFKVRIRPANEYLALPNGTRGDLRKGLTLSARFLVARRSVFQLLYDDASAWLNPHDQRPTT